MKKKILLVTPPFSGHTAVFRYFVDRYADIYDIHILVTGWTNIQSDLRDVSVPVTDVAISALHETDPALWTLPRVAELYDRVKQYMSTLQPDLVIYDFFSLEAPLAARELGIPYWASVPAMIGPYDDVAYVAQKLDTPENGAALAQLADAHGISLQLDDFELISDGLHISGERNVIWSYESVVDPNYARNRKTVPYHFVGSLASIVRRQSQENTEIVYFSLGTVVMENLWNNLDSVRVGLRRFIGGLAACLQDPNISVVFPAFGKHVLDTYPSHWQVIDRADQLQELSRASVFITHGGSNSFHEALLYGVPMIVVPFFGDQLLVARRVQELGIGFSVVDSGTVDTRAHKDFLNEDVAQRVCEHVHVILNNKASFKERFSRLSLKHENIAELIARSLA